MDLTPFTTSSHNPNENGISQKKHFPLHQRTRFVLPTLDISFLKERTSYRWLLQGSTGGSDQLSPGRAH